MTEKCDLFPEVTNSKGEKVPSKLFFDLQDIIKDRKRLIDVYIAATSSFFLDKVSGEDVVFDENGEITLHSLIKYGELDVKDEVLISKLNKNIQSGEYSFTEAITKAKEFNKSEYSDKFLATLDKVSEKSYRLSVVKNTTENLERFEKTVADRYKVLNLIETLEKYNVGVKFINNKSLFNGKFSSENIDQAYDGLYRLIVLNKGRAENLDEVFVEEACHFAIASMYNSPLVERLIDLCSNEEFVKRLNINMPNSTENTQLSTEEIAGRVLAKAYMGESLFEYGGFLSRVTGFLKSIFSPISEVHINRMRNEAETLAHQIINDFNSGKGSVENMSLYHTVTMYNDDNIPMNQLLRQVSTAVRLLSYRYRELGKTHYSNFRSKVGIDNILNLEEYEKKAKDPKVAATFICAAIEDVVSDISDIVNGINQVISEGKISLSNVGLDIFDTEIPIFLYRLNDAIESFDSIKSLLSGRTDSEMAIIKSTLEKSDTRNLVDKCKTLIADWTVRLAAISVEEVMGKEGVEIKGIIRLKKGQFKHPGNIDDYYDGSEIVSGTGKVTATDVVTKIYKTESWINDLLASFTKMSDLGLSYLHKLKRSMTQRVNRILLEDYSGKMELLMKEAKRLGYDKDMSELIEPPIKGGGRVNFISRNNWYIFYEERKRIKDKIIAKTKREGTNLGLSKREINALIKERLEDPNGKLAKFEKESLINEGRDLNPDYENGIYINTKYIDWELAPKGTLEHDKYEFLQALLEYKKQLEDTYLISPDGEKLGHLLRIPQIEYKRKLINVDIGSKPTQSRNPLETVRRFPVYGVNIIPNSSTNVMETLKIYTAMAVKYGVIKDYFYKLSFLGKQLKARKLDTNTFIDRRSNGDLARMMGAIDQAVCSTFWEDNYKLKLGDSNFTTIAAHLCNLVFIAKCLLFNLPRSVSRNFCSAVNGWIAKSFSSDSFSFGGFAGALSRSLFTHFEKTPILKNIGKKDTDIVKYVNGLQGRRVLWEDLKKDSPWVKHLIYDSLMSIYSKGDEIPQQAIYLAALNYHTSWDLSKIMSKALSASNEEIKMWFLDLEKGNASIKIPTHGLVDSFDYTEEEDSHLYFKNHQLKKGEDASKYFILYKLRQEINAALELNSKMDDNLSTAPRISTESLIDDLSNNWNMAALYEKVSEYLFTDNPDSVLFAVDLKELGKLVDESIKSMVYTNEDIVSIIDSILSESSEVQGLYYTGAKSKLLEYQGLKDCAVFLGYANGYFDRNFLSGFDTLKGKYDNSRALIEIWNLYQFINPNKTDDKSRRLSVLAASVPVVNSILVRENSAATRVLKSMGYTDSMIARLKWSHDLYGLLLLWLFLSNLSKDRSTEAAASQYGKGEEGLKSTRSKESRVKDFPSIKVLDDPGFKKEHMLFDKFINPTYNKDNTIKSLQSKFGKDNITPLVRSIHSISREDDKKFLYILDSVCDGIVDYSNKISSPVSSSMTKESKVSLFNSCIQKATGYSTIRINPNIINRIYKKEGGTKVYLLDKNGEPNEKNPVRFNIYDADDAILFSRQLRATTFKGVDLHDVKEDTPEGDAKFILSMSHYYSTLIYNEFASSALMSKNLLDLSTGLVFGGSANINSIKWVRDLCNVATSEDGNLDIKLKKDVLDAVFANINRETDEFGRAFYDPDEIQTSYDKEKKIGLHRIDFYNKTTKLQNYEKRK